MSLIPGKQYYLKWSSMYPDNPDKIENMLILACEFMKYNDHFSTKKKIKNKIYNYNNYNEYVKLLEEHNGNVPVELRSKFVGNLIDQSGNFIVFPFENPLSMYTTNNSPYYLKPATPKKLGLFKILRMVNCIYNGDELPGNYMIPGHGYEDIFVHGQRYSHRKHFSVVDGFIADFTKFSSNVRCNRYNKIHRHSTPEFACELNNGSLLWIDLEHVKILEDFTQRVTHYHTLNQLEPRLGRDTTGEIAKYVGSISYMDKLKNKGGKKSRKNKKKTNKYKKSKKNKTKRHH